MSANPRHLDLVDRLRGQYHLPVNDGAGPIDGSMTFSRQFETPPIQHEAAALIQRMREIITAALPSIEHAWKMTPGGSKKSARLAILRSATAIVQTPYVRRPDDPTDASPSAPVSLNQT